MCETDIIKGKEEQLQILMNASREAERARIITIILQVRSKLDLKEEDNIKIYDELTYILDRIEGK